MKFNLVFLFIFLGMALSAQRNVLPGQELLYPFLNDPSFVGENSSVEATGLLQVSDSERKQTSQYLFAQMPIYDNLALGVDYFKDYFGYFSYSGARLSLAAKIGLGCDRHYIKIGGSAGIGTQRQDRIPLGQLPDDENFVPGLDMGNQEFSYRAGLHYSNGGFTIGGFYNEIPVQKVLSSSGTEELLDYNVEQGCTGYLQYQIRLSSALRVTPIARYLNYSNTALYEGALRIDYKNWLSTSFSYKNEYSLNPALQLRLFNSLFIGYSYETAMAEMQFEDVHSLSLSYRFKKGNGEETPEWEKNAAQTIREIESIKPVKKKKTAPIKEEKEVDVPMQESEEKVSVEQIEQNETEEKAAPIQNAVVIEMVSRYYLVAKSFDTYQNAYRYKESLKSSGFKALVGSTGSEAGYHVFIDSDIDKNSATSLLKQYQKNELLDGIYILEPK